MTVYFLKSFKIIVQTVVFKDFTDFVKTASLPSVCPSYTNRITDCDKEKDERKDENVRTYARTITDCSTETGSYRGMA